MRCTRAAIFVWDGMRPDLISPELTPNLTQLGNNGVWFDAARAVFPTVTRINAATLATGAVAATHGLPANVVYASAVDPTGPISFGEGDSFRSLRRAYGVFAAPTLADAVAHHGGRSIVVSNGTRGSATMCHPHWRERGDLLLHPTLAEPRELQPLAERFGPLPAASLPDTERNRWFARAVAEYILPELRPELLVVWRNDPDKSQHHFGFGHPKSLGSIRAADDDLGTMLGTLDRLGLRAETAVVVVSDHGYAQVDGRVDLAAELVLAGLKESPTSTDVVVAPNGNAVLLYLPGDDGGRAVRVADFLQDWEGAAVVFSGARGRPILDGTFPLADVGIDGPLAPDLLVALHWSDAANEHGYPGSSAENGSANRASHGGLSPWELRNTLVIAGPGIRRGVRSAAPAGNIDVTPTLLHLLNLPAPPTVQGRILAEAISGAAPVEPSVSRNVDARDHRGVRSELHWSVVAAHRYLDYGRRTSASGIDRQAMSSFTATGGQ